MSMFNPTIIVTHSGSFHPDDAFSVATLQILLNQRGERHIKVIRSRDAAVIEKGDYVVDVGGLHVPEKNRFDHHQIGGAGTRENGIPYASFGLVWKRFGVEICSGSARVAMHIDQDLVQPVDAHDNGVEIIKNVIPEIFPYTVSNAISSFLPSWKEASQPESRTDEMFMRAVAVARSVLEREISKAKDNEEGKVIVEHIYNETKDKRVIVFPLAYPWAEVLALHPEVLYAIYPQSNKWHVKAVKKELNSFKTRKDFPAEWAGKKDAELAQITGVADAIFAHNNRFLVGAASKEGALKLAQLALEA